LSPETSDNTDSEIRCETEDESIRDDKGGTDSWKGTGQLHVEGGRCMRGRQCGTRSKAPSEEDQYRAKQTSKTDTEAGEDDLILVLDFDQASTPRTCDKYADLPSVEEGLRVGMKLHVPHKLVGEGKVVSEDKDGQLKELTNGKTYSFSNAHLAKCTELGIDQMICNPSGGGKKYEVALLDYTDMIPETPETPHVRCVFVKPDDIHEYRRRYTDLILVGLPDRSEIPGLNKIAPVGDARFWIKAFVTQLRLYAEKRGDSALASATFFKRCFMLDDDVICLHELKSGTPDEPCTLHYMLRNSRYEPPPPLIGFHCRWLPGKQRQEPWTADNQLATPLATALSVSTDEGSPQFHPYAELGEDVGFDQALRLAKKEKEEIASLKCNRFGYTRVSSGNTHGANREATPFADELVKILAKIGFDQNTKIYHTGTYPLLKPIHAWSWQNVEGQFKNTDFIFTRPDENHMGNLRDRSIEQGVMTWLNGEDLPHCEAGIAFKDAFELFHRKLKGPLPGLLVATDAAIEELPLGLRNLYIPEVLQPGGPPVAQLQVWWRPGTPTDYRLCKVVPRVPLDNAQSPSASLQVRAARQTPLNDVNVHLDNALSPLGSPPPALPPAPAPALAPASVADFNWTDLYSTQSLPKSATEVLEKKERDKNAKNAAADAEAAAADAAAREVREEEERRARREREHREAVERLQDQIKMAREAMRHRDKRVIAGCYTGLNAAIRRVVKIQKEAIKSKYKTGEAYKVFKEIQEIHNPVEALCHELEELMKLMKKNLKVDNLEAHPSVEKVKRLLNNFREKLKKQLNYKVLKQFVERLSTLNTKLENSAEGGLRLTEHQSYLEDELKNREMQVQQQKQERAQAKAAAREKELRQEQARKRLILKQEQRAMKRRISVEELRKEEAEDQVRKKRQKLEMERADAAAIGISLRELQWRRAQQRKLRMRKKRMEARLRMQEKRMMEQERLKTPALESGGNAADNERTDSDAKPQTDRRCNQYKIPRKRKFGAQEVGRGCLGVGPDGNEHRNDRRVVE